MTRTDILVVGGGLAGTAVAYYLARGGADVLLIERSEINAAASGANSGSIHAQIPLEPFLEQGEAWTRGFAPTIPLMIESIRLWSGLEAELGADLEVGAAGRADGGRGRAPAPHPGAQGRGRAGAGAAGRDPVRGRSPPDRTLSRARPRRRGVLPDRGQGQPAEGGSGLRPRRRTATARG